MVSKAETAIENHLTSRGYKVVEIRREWLSLKSIFGSGLSNAAVVYKAEFELPDGTTSRATYAYDPAGGWVGRGSGLKRYSSGSWFDA